MGRLTFLVYFLLKPYWNPWRDIPQSWTLYSRAWRDGIDYYLDKARTIPIEFRNINGEPDQWRFKP